MKIREPILPDNLDTPFRAAARNLKAPTGRNFDPSQWQEVFETTSAKSDDDYQLLLSAIWIGTQTAQLRQQAGASPLEEIGSAMSAILAVGMVNREYLTMRDLVQTKIKENKRDYFATLLEIANTQVAGAIPGQNITADSLNEAIIDSLDSWLYDACRNPKGKTSDDDADLSRVALWGASYYSIQHGLGKLWQQALWEGHHLVCRDDKIIWTPADKKLAVFSEAWRTRQQANYFNFPSIDSSVWLRLSIQERKRLASFRTVLDARVSPRRKIKVGRVSVLSRHLPHYLAEIGGLEGSYLASFLDEPLPNAANLTCRLICQAWHVLADLARLLLKEFVIPPKHLTGRVARSLSINLSLDEIHKCLSEALGADTKTTSDLIEFLSFKPGLSTASGQRGLWAAPLVRIPSENTFSLVVPALVASNPLRKAEAILDRGGIDKALGKLKKGKHFEAILREDIASAIESNKLLKNSSASRQPIKRDKKSDEEIDIIFHINTLLIVGEIKFFVTPADSIEIYNHFKKLREAAKQASRKAAYIASNRHLIGTSLGVSLDDANKMDVLPVVITNHGFGMASTAGDSTIIDAHFLETYLGSNEIVTGQAINMANGKTSSMTSVLYRSEDNAANVFLSTMKNPPTLLRFVDAASWDGSIFPTSPPMFVEFPAINDLTREERRSAELAASVII